jgi:hypothetical protein
VVSNYYPVIQENAAPKKGHDWNSPPITKIPQCAVPYINTFAKNEVRWPVVV